MLAAGKLRKLPERSGPMRVIEMRGVEFNACGGTHVVSTGAIGSLLLRRLERVKQGWRVEFLCGLRAVRAARRDYVLLAEIASILSVGAVDAVGRIAALQEENKAAAKERRALLEQLAAACAAELLATSQNGVMQMLYREKPVEFAKRVAATVAKGGRDAAIGATEGVHGAVALAVPAGSGHNAGQVLREVLATHGRSWGWVRGAGAGCLPGGSGRSAGSGAGGSARACPLKPFRVWREQQGSPFQF